MTICKHNVEILKLDLWFGPEILESVLIEDSLGRSAKWFYNNNFKFSHPEVKNILRSAKSQ